MQCNLDIHPLCIGTSKYKFYRFLPSNLPPPSSPSYFMFKASSKLEFKRVVSVNYLKHLKHK